MAGRGKSFEVWLNQSGVCKLTSVNNQLVAVEPRFEGNGFSRWLAKDTPQKIRFVFCNSVPYHFGVDYMDCVFDLTRSPGISWFPVCGDIRVFKFSEFATRYGTFQMAGNLAYKCYRQTNIPISYLCSMTNSPVLCFQYLKLKYFLRPQGWLTSCPRPGYRYKILA